MNSNLNFDCVSAKDIQDAISLLNKYGDESKIFAGGTELLVNIKQHAMSPKVLIDIKFISDLTYIKFEENNLKVDYEIRLGINLNLKRNQVLLFGNVNKKQQFTYKLNC